MAGVEEKGNLTDYANCLCSRDGGMSGGKSPAVVYQSPKNVTPGKVVKDPEAVSAIQGFLNKRTDGSSVDQPIKQDGQWGTGTSSAFYRRMIEIQEQNGIKPTGEYNKATEEAMRKSGLGKEADALSKMKQEGTLDRVYNHRLAKVICDGVEAAAKTTAPKLTTEAAKPSPVNADDAMRGIQKALGMSGDIKDPSMMLEIASVVQDKIKEAQKRADLPQNGEYTGKTIEAMRQDPQTKELAEALDKARPAAEKLDGPQAKTSPQSQTYRLGDVPSDGGKRIRLDEGTGIGTPMQMDFLTMGGIKADPLTPAFSRAMANMGPLSLDTQSPQINQSFTAPTTRFQLNNNM